MTYPELEKARKLWQYQPDNECLAGKTILITGASAGIGKTAAKTFASFGANIVLLARERTKLEAVYDWITTNTQAESAIVPCDLLTLTDDSAFALQDSIEENFGQLDGLLHNASMLGPRTPVAHYGTSEWQNLMQVNATAPFILTKILEPTLRKAKHASVVFTSSSVGRQGRAYWGAYAVSKFALEGLTQVLADEYDTAGQIRFNSLNPGATRTNMRAAAYPAEDPSTLATAEQHMALYLYLMADDSVGVNGQQFDARNWQMPEN